MADDELAAIRAARLKELKQQQQQQKQTAQVVLFITDLVLTQRSGGTLEPLLMRPLSSIYPSAHAGANIG